MPETTAAMPAAVNALIIKSYANMSVMMVVAMLMAVVVQMIGALDIQPPRHHENMPVGAEHLNFCAEKLR